MRLSAIASLVALLTWHHPLRAQAVDVDLSTQAPAPTQVAPNPPAPAEAAPDEAASNEAAANRYPPTQVPQNQPGNGAATPSGGRHRLVWREEWPRFRPIEYVATSVGGASAVALFAFGGSAKKANWDGPILFDEPARNALRARGREDLTNLRMVGDIFTVAPVIYVAVVDSLVVPSVDRSFDVAWQMSMMNAQSFALSGLMAWTMFKFVGRARPSYRECTNRTTDDPLCNSGTFADFPSGHTMTAFTAAGLSCVHHANIPLYGGGLPDHLACASSLGLATTAGVFRLLGDRHYASDVIVGAGLGFAIGDGLPSLLHYRARPVTELHASRHLKVGVAPGTAGAPLGVGLFGFF